VHRGITTKSVLVDMFEEELAAIKGKARDIMSVRGRGSGREDRLVVLLARPQSNQADILRREEEAAFRAI